MLPIQTGGRRDKPEWSEYHSLFFHPVPTAQAQAMWRNAVPPWGLSSAKLIPEAAGITGYFVATSDVVNTLEIMLLRCAWPASKNVNVKLAYLGSSFMKHGVPALFHVSDYLQWDWTMCLIGTERRQAERHLVYCQAKSSLFILTVTLTCICALIVSFSFSTLVVLPEKSDC